MSRGIEISPKHGVNPTIPCCAWCGQEKNEIALLGRIRKYDERQTAYGGISRRVVDNDAQAPMKMILDYNPCDECAQKWAQGVTVIEVNTFPVQDNQMPIQDGLYPTGRHVVMKPEGAVDLFTDESLHKAGARCFMDVPTFTQIFQGVL